VLLFYRYLLNMYRKSVWDTIVCGTLEPFSVVALCYFTFLSRFFFSIVLKNVAQMLQKNFKKELSGEHRIPRLKEGSIQETEKCVSL